MAILPPQLFLTPFTNPWERPAVGSASLGEYGEMQVNAQLKREQMAAQKAQAAAEMQLNQSRLGIQQQEVSGRNKYYDDQIRARAEESGARSQMAKDKRLSELTDALRKAAHAGDWATVDLIRQQMGAMGHASEVTPSAAPPVENPDLSIKASEMGLPPDLLKAPTPSEKVKPTKPLDEGFKKQLAASVAGTPDVPTEGAAPMPWEMLGLPGAPPPAAPKAREGKITVRAPDGTPTVVIDAPMEKQQRERMVSEALEPFIADASNPEEKAAATMARKAAVAASKIEGVTPEKAAEIGRTAYEKEMNRFFQERRPGAPGTGGGGGGELGMSKQEQTRKGMVFQHTLAAMRETRAEEVLAEAKKIEGRANKIEELLSSKDPFQNRMAMMEELHGLIGGNQTKTELDTALNGAGKIPRLQMQVNAWTSGGAMPDEIRRGFAEVSAAAKKIARERIDRAGDSVAQFIRDVPGIMTPEEREQAAEAARNHVRGGGRVTGGGGKMDPGKQKAIDAARKLLGGP